MPEAILGISAYYHDSAAALLVDGEIIAAAHEERFTRKKHDASFPHHAVKYVLSKSNVLYDTLAAVVFYDKPFLKFERLLETYHAFAPRGLTGFLAAAPIWIKEKLFIKKILRRELSRFGSIPAQILFPEHHLSHAASAFYPSPFDEAAILTIDGVGEWATSTIGHGQGNRIKILQEQRFPHSLGLLYSTFTYYIGFKVNSGEYKLMGLAPYGNPDGKRFFNLKQKILTELVDVREDGSILLNMDYFRFATGLKMSNNKKWAQLFGIPPRKPESTIEPDHLDMALAIQQVAEEIILKLSITAKELTQSDNLAMAGGVALNSVANGKILKAQIFNDIWIQPAAGDAGGALGSAYAAWYIWKNRKRNSIRKPDAMKGALLGPDFDPSVILSTILRNGTAYKHYDHFNKLATDVADLLSQGNIIGWFQGRMEFGPRALGNRSILGDARDPEMQKKINLKIKYREGFRPFAPAVLEEDVNEYFHFDGPSPYMLFVVPVKRSRRNPMGDHDLSKDPFARLYCPRSDIPAVTHVDYSARIQSINKTTNPRFWNLINAFKRQTGYGIIVNTSFNVRGEPIVCTPEDAYRCFMNTEMDYLVMGDYLLEKKNSPT
ncbi:MAG: carbamoyltransferase [Deltaproteobacteria bacterium]|nr:carbamoyltransferase [Deltaproteobacteria bacterium]